MNQPASQRKREKAGGKEGWGADSEKDSTEDGMRKYGAIDQCSREEVRWKRQVVKRGRERESERNKF